MFLEQARTSLTLLHYCVTSVTHNVGMTVVHKLNDSHVSFRANDALVSALTERARRSGCSVSEYLRGLVRDRVGLN